MPTRTRPKRMDPPVLAPVSKSTPARRGRPAAHADEAQREAEPRKKRGRPSKVKQEEPVTPVKNTPKRGRPSKMSALNLSRVAGSPRVTKTGGTSTSKPAVLRPQRLARSGLSQPSYSQSSVQKLQVQKPAAKRGRPRKATQVEKPAVKRGRPRGVVQKLEIQAPAVKRGRPRKILTEAVLSKKVISRKEVIQVKPKSIRKRRGFTMLEIPDKFVAQVKQFLQERIDADSSDTIHLEETQENNKDEDGSESSSPEQREDTTQQDPEQEQEQQEQLQVHETAQTEGHGAETERTTLVSDSFLDPILDTALDLYAQQLGQVA